MEKKLASVSDALRSHSREFYTTSLERAEKQQRDFVNRFPLSEWPRMSLEEFALGGENPKDTLCHWVHSYHKTGACGSIGQGWGGKQLICKPLKEPDRYSEGKSYKNEQEDWEDVRAGFIEAFEKAKAGQWDEIDEIPSIRPAHALRMKVLYMYFPDEVIPICSQGDLRLFLEALNHPRAETRKWGVVRLNRELLRSLREIPKLADWKPKEFEPLLYLGLRFRRRAVKIGVEEVRPSWDECRERGYLSFGGDGIGDPGRFDTQEAYKAQFRELYAERYGHNALLIARKASELWTLVNLEPEDVVIAAQGASRVLAVGEVVEPGYEWKPQRPESPHVVHVDWDTSHAKDIEPQTEWASFAVAEVRPHLYQRILKRKGRTQPEPPKP